MIALEDVETVFKREMLIFRSNLKVNLARSAIFPLVIILFFGGIGSSVSNVPIVVVNYANNPQSRSFISGLETSNYLRVIALTDQATAQNMLQTGKTQIVVIVLPTFPSSTPNVPGIQVYYANTQFAVTAFVLPLISNIASKYGGGGGIRNYSLSAQSLSTPSSSSIGQVAFAALYAQKGSYKDFVVGGIIPMVIIFGALFGSGFSIIADRQLGNLKAFFITPVSRDSITTGRIASGTVQSVVYASLALIIGVLDGAHIAMGALGLIYIALIAIVAGVGFNSIALIMASKLKRVEVFAIFSQAMALPLWFISGGIVPVQSLPSWLVPISVVDPLTYANEISRAVILQGFISLQTTVVDFGVLIAFALVCLYACLRTFRNLSEEDI